MNNELMRDENFIRCSTMIAELLMKYKSMETEEDQEGWMQEGASSPLLFLLRLFFCFSGLENHLVILYNREKEDDYY